MILSTARVIIEPWWPRWS